MATMKDIARLANVSTSTVSHVINNSRFVSEEIRKKVLKVVDELDYKPSALARSLKVKETKTLGMLVTTSDNPFFSEVVTCVERYCSKLEYNLILCNTDGKSDRIEKSCNTLIQKQVDGLLLMCTESHFESQLPILSTPAVVMDWWPEDLKVDKVFENSKLGGFLATETLIKAGHTKIAIITGSLKKHLARQRLEGYKEALIKYNIPICREWIIESHFSCTGGIVGMEKLLTASVFPTALFASSDTIALGAYQVAWRANLNIPNDLSIIGYDDISLAKYLSPPLSSVCQPKEQLAKTAVDLLLSRIKKQHRKIKEIHLDPKIINRDSIYLK